VYRDWQLPPAFGELRQTLEKRLGPRTGPRQFIRVLQLLAHHPLARVEAAIVACARRGVCEAAAITSQVARLARAEPTCRDNTMSFSDNAMSYSDNAMSRNETDTPGGNATLAALRVPAPDLTQFNRLLSQYPQGDPAHDATDGLATQGQSQTVETPHHVRRVGEAGP
jgi:hypothetical protein